MSIVDESISNFDFGTINGEVSATSSTTMFPPQQYSIDSTNHDQEPPQKKKRNLPGYPDPDSEVIALSPNSLMTSNRFLCEVCSKGFKRDQNLQLHRRGHNLPWKLKQKSKINVKRKVYVCPEVSCVHHDPLRALGDLTGIKKHFCRKHGDKKWKCDKCSKRYAVQSDWKAHSKICGTREYRCDCGTLFSRRDSFITHRAFCDALAQEGARTTTMATNPFFPPNSDQIIPNLIQNHNNLQTLSSVKREQDHHYQNLLMNSRNTINDHHHNTPQWITYPQPEHHPHPHGLSSSPLLYSGSSLDQNPSFNIQAASTSSPHMSATSLLQKAAQMGVSLMGNNMLHQVSHMQMMQQSQAPETIVAPPLHVHADSSPFENKVALPCIDFNEMMISMSSDPNESSSSFDEVFNGRLNPKRDTHFQENFSKETQFRESGVHGHSYEMGGGDGEFTRDFLNLTPAGIKHLSSSSSTYNGDDTKSRTPWQG